MASRCSLVLLLSGVVACASGSDQPKVDARVAEPDAAMVDGPVAIDAAADDAAIVDAPTDAAVVDARLIDAPLIDARLIDARLIDAPMVDAPTDAPTIDGPPPVIASLLLTELVLAPTGGELIEILNPTDAPIDLSGFYLSDAPLYWKLPQGLAAVALDNADFVIRFPAGASIAAHGVVTISIDSAAAFNTSYTVAPTYSVGAASGGAVAMTSLTSGGAPTLTNTGEPVALFFWDGASDRITDVDLMVAGTPSSSNGLVSKSGVAIDGPDPGTETTAYLSDANTLPTQTAPASLKSTKRIALESPAVETQAGAGNGIDGHDETSEQTGTTWDNAAYTAPTPGTVPAALLP